MDHRRAVARDDHRARGRVQVKAMLALVLAGSVAYADPPGETPPTPPPPAPLQPAAQRLPPNIERVEPPPNARTEAWVATGVTAAVVGIGVFSVVEMREASNTANEYFGQADHFNEWHAAVVDNDKWFHATLLFGGLSVASVAVTGILWSRSQPSFRVAATPSGGYIGYAARF